MWTNVEREIIKNIFLSFNGFFFIIPDSKQYFPKIPTSRAKEPSRTRKKYNEVSSEPTLKLYPHVA